MKRSKKGNQSGLIKTATTTRQNKRAKRKTYSTTKSKAQSAQAQTIEPEKQTNAVNGQNKPYKPIKSFDSSKLKILKLLVSGTTDVNEIASAMGMQQAYVGTMIKKIQAEVLSMSIDEYRSLLNRKLIQLLHNHTTSSSTLALELHKLDCDIDVIDGLLGTHRLAGDASLIKQRASLASTRLTMLREQRDSNASLFSTLSKVGVSQVALEKKKEGSIPLSPNNKNSDLGGSSKGSNLEVSKNSLVSSEPGVTASILDISGYSGVSKAAALAELKRSTKQMDKYLKEQGSEKKSGWYDDSTA